MNADDILLGIELHSSPNIIFYETMYPCASSVYSLT